MFIISSRSDGNIPHSGEGEAERGSRAQYKRFIFIKQTIWDRTFHNRLSKMTEFHESFSFSLFPNDRSTNEIAHSQKDSINEHFDFLEENVISRLILSMELYFISLYFVFDKGTRLKMHTQKKPVYGTI